MSSLINGLVSLWEFEGVLSDSIGSNALTLSGSSAYAAALGNVGKGFSFNGTTDLSKTTPSGLSLANTITVGIVCKITATAAQAFLVDRLGGTEGFGIYITATNSYPSISLNGGLGSATGSAAIDDGNLQFVMVTYDKDAGSNQIKVYVNNSNVANGTYSSAISYSPDPNLIIGGTGGANRLPNGSIIYQLPIWNRVLTADERAAWYSGGNGMNFFKKPATIIF